MKHLLLSAAILWIATGAASAADNCTDAADQATMNACAADALKTSDAELNTLYRQIEARLKDDAETTKLLVTAQRAWVAFRDAECTFSASGAAEGSVYPMVYAVCLDGMTQERVKQLQAYLNCEEGDMSCPVPASE